MNLWDIVILAAVAAAVILAVRRVRRNKGGCSCGCGGCAVSDACGKQEKKS